MRIEILVGSEEPLVFPLNSARTSVGSAEFCDISLNASGVSRKHLVIQVEGENFYVTDQGSTNGSFINEVRLIPGRRVEFTSFFPVRLGDNVLLSLLSEAEDLDDINPPVKEMVYSGGKTPEGATTVINLKDLGIVRTEKLILERNQKREMRKKSQTKQAPKAKVKKKINIVPYLSLLIVGLGGYYNFFVMRPEVEDTKIVVKRPVVINKKIKPVTSELIPSRELPSKETFTKLLADIKCTNDIEIYLCDIIPGARGPGFGVAQIGLTFHVMIDGTPYFEAAKQYLNYSDLKDPKLVKLADALLQQTAIYIFLMKDMPLLDETKFQDAKIAIAFYKPSETGAVIDQVLAFYPKVFNREKPKFTEDQLNYVKSLGLGMFDFAKNIYSVY